MTSNEPEPDMPLDLTAKLIGMEAEEAAKALVGSIGDDGKPTAETVEMAENAVLLFASAPHDDVSREVEAATYVATLIGCLAEMAAQCQRELTKRGITVNWK